MNPTFQFITVTIWHDKMDDLLHHSWCYTKTSDEAWAHTIYIQGYLAGLSVNWPDRISYIYSYFCKQDEFASYKIPQLTGYDIGSKKAAIMQEILNPQPKHFVEYP